MVLQELMFKAAMKWSNAVSHESFMKSLVKWKQLPLDHVALTTDCLLFREFQIKSLWRSGCCAWRLRRHLSKSPKRSSRWWHPSQPLSASCLLATGYRYTNTCSFAFQGWEKHCLFILQLVCVKCLTVFISSCLPLLSSHLRYVLRWLTPQV